MAAPNTTIVRETIFPDGHLLSLNDIRIGSYTTGGVAYKATSQFRRIFDAKVNTGGTVNAILQVKSLSGAGSFTVFARGATGGTLQELSNNRRIVGSHRVLLIGNPIG